MKRTLDWLQEPVDGSSMALVRIAIGLSALLLLAFDWARLGPQLAAPSFHFTYTGFDWVEALPWYWMKWFGGLLIGLAVMVTVGLLQRPASALLCGGMAYLFLIDQARYSNNAYFLILALLLLSLSPASRVWAADAKLFRERAGWVPRWTPVGMGVLAAVPLVYMGLARMNSDWLSGYPLILWFKVAAREHWLGDAVADLLAKKAFAVAWSWFAAIVYLAVVPMLLWRRTRWASLLLFVGCYAGYSLIFGRVIFPFGLFAAMLAFLTLSTPHRVWAGLSQEAAAVDSAGKRGGSLWLAMSAVLLACHALLPARALLYPGQSAWTGDGYRFSWLEMLHDRHCENQYTVVDPASGRSWVAAASTRVAAFQLPELAVRPDMMLQFAHELERQYKVEFSLEDVQVFLRSKCSLNTRPYAQFVDPKLDLTTIPPKSPGYVWTLPFDARMPPGWRGIVTPL